MTAAEELAPNLFEMHLSRQLEFSFAVDGWLLVGLALLAAATLLWRHFWGGRRLRDFEIDEAEFGIGDQKFTLRPNDLDTTVAYKIWVELSTRKIGLQIDLEHDVIEEIYDSWYSFFAITRDLIKDVPVRKIRRDSTQKIVRLSIDVLNEGLRPHLTQWQARFRRWYVTLPPSFIQRDVDSGGCFGPAEPGGRRGLAWSWPLSAAPGPVVG